MGASNWSYVTPFHPDPQRALDALRAEVFARDAEYYADGGVHSLAELDASELLAEEGAHSVLDVSEVVRCAEDTEEVGQVRMVESAEAVELFGSDRPTRELVEAVVGRSGDGWIPPFARGCGCCTALYGAGAAADAAPEAYCFWGRSGD